MKKLLTALMLFAFFTSAKAQNIDSAGSKLMTYEVSSDAEGKILKGYISRYIIESDTSFKWFKENMKWGTANADAVTALNKHGDQLHFMVFSGTWCHDSQNLLPVFYRLADKASLPDSQITLIGVDRNKTALNGMHTAFNVKNVPTIIVMKEGKEIGRVVEYGKYGAIDKEIGEIITAAGK